MRRSSIEKLEALLGRRVRITFTDSAQATGRLTAIKRSTLTIDDGSRGVDQYPSAIELDGEPSFTHQLTSIRKIELLARVEVANDPRVAVSVERVLPPTRIEPRRVIKFEPPTSIDFED